MQIKFHVAGVPAILAFLFVFGCSDDQEGAPGTGALSAPVIEEVMPMEGVLHVSWQNAQPDCDAVEGERKPASGDYTMAFSVPGNVDNKMDTGATPAGTYSYRLRCKKGTAYSPYSNEMSGAAEGTGSGGTGGMSGSGGMAGMDAMAGMTGMDAMAGMAGTHAAGTHQ
jgi:hypothetical protein